MDRIRILLVDDEPSRLLTYETVLGNLGEELIRANSGDEALEYLLRHDIAIVLTDVSMHGHGGFDLADAIRGHPRFKDTAIIFISGTRMTDTDRLKGYEHGAVDYITIPIVPELLRAKVRVFAQLYRNRRELEKMSSQMVVALDQERRRIARELHDGLGQELTMAKMMVDGLRASHSEERVVDASKLIDGALRQMRSISYLLHPPLLEELGLESAVRWCLEGLTERSGIETSVEIQPQDLPRLLPHIENAIYRIIQEALTNAFRHSGARNVFVTLTQNNGCVFLAVRDDGKGIPVDLAECRPGVGLGGMMQRAKELDGTLRLINANPGTLVEVVIPNKGSELFAKL